MGYLFAAPILILCTLNGLLVIASTIAQTLVGITFQVGVYFGLIGSWILLGVFSTWLTVLYLRHLSEAGNRQVSESRASFEVSRMDKI